MLESDRRRLGAARARARIGILGRALAAAATLSIAPGCAPPKVECPKKRYEPPDERFVFFTLGKSEINADGLFAIGYVVAQLEGDPALHVLVVGHADAQGRSDANRDLSLRRARVVRKLLLDHGVKEGRILLATPKDFSEASSAQMNRRADLFVYDPVQDEASKRLGYPVDLKKD